MEDSRDENAEAAYEQLTSEREEDQTTSEMRAYGMHEIGDHRYA